MTRHSASRDILYSTPPGPEDTDDGVTEDVETGTSADATAGDDTEAAAADD